MLSGRVGLQLGKTSSYVLYKAKQPGMDIRQERRGLSGHRRHRVGPADLQASVTGPAAGPGRTGGDLEGERPPVHRPQAREDEGGMVRVPPRPGRASQGRPRGTDSPPRGTGGEVRGRQRMTTDSWRVRVSVRGAGLWVLGPDHARHAPY